MRSSIFEFDAVVIGAGLNGLAAATLLARSGWKVLVAEAASNPGGAVRTAEVTLPGFLHDLYATNLNQFAGSAFNQAFRDELGARGLTLIRASKPFGSVFADGDFVGVSTSLDETLGALRRLSPHDADAWEALTRRFGRIARAATGAMRAPMPSWGMLRGLPAASIALQSSGEFVARHFRHPKVQAMWAAWGLHLDFPPHIRGGALYPFLSCMGAQSTGIVLAKGGAGRLIDSIMALFQDSGGELRCGAAVERIAVEQGRAIGVVVKGKTIRARRAVIANLSPKPLSGLVEFPIRRFRYGPGTMMIHLALSDLPSWRAEQARECAYVHIGPSLAAMSLAYEEAKRGRLPKEPVLVVAQPTVVDPTRAPQGRHVVSIQVRVVPPAMDKEAYADHIVSLVDRYAPGLSSIVLARCVLSPADLERANANLVGGDSIGGSHHPGQQYVFRPFLGWSRYRTPLPDLYICGASTWPGAGTSAGSGWLLGRMLLQ